ncbi:hypothetical protein [Solibacillus sp. FSL W8-0372]|uniref:hypothetical protein n=1 Tax=Solibacillus sp. FSL W8-0372 TaxID=2921713 RepID=UPI0030D24AEB
MKKILLCISFLCIMFTVVGCSEQEEAVTGEFLLGNFGFELLSNETYHLVVPFEWTGESPVTIDSIELIKKDNNPITYEEDGIKYEFFGADPLKKPGIYGNRDIGDKKNINNFEIDGKGKIILKILADNVKEDSDRRLKIKFKSNGEENEKIVEWKTLEQFSTDNN